MKTLVLIAIGIGLLGGLVLAQNPPAPKTRIKVKGYVVGVDVWTEAGNISFAPQQQMLLVRTARILKGTEQANFLKISYRYFGEPEASFSNLISGDGKPWIFKLARDTSCDSTLEEMKFAKSVSVNGRETRQLLRLKDLGGLSEISESTKLPCYVLSKRDFKSA